MCHGLLTDIGLRQFLTTLIQRLSCQEDMFVKSLTTSNKCAVRYLSALCQDDRRTLLGRTLCKIGLDCGVAPSDLSANLVKSSLQYFPVPDDQQWRVPLLLELLDARSDKMTIENLTSNQISDIIDNICTS